MTTVGTGSGAGDNLAVAGLQSLAANASAGLVENYNINAPIFCESQFCSTNGICCGYDSVANMYFCASHCSCNNRTGEVECTCDAGFSKPPSCMQQVPPTVWLAVILTVGTLLVLFIAWGFRCQDDGADEEMQRAPRDPLLREATSAAAAAARPFSTRGTTDNRTTAGENSLTGAGTAGGDASMQRRTCCVCLDKPIQVVLIPCGHACLCRKCSRKLETCPICRLQIQATQRFYF